MRRSIAIALLAPLAWLTIVGAPAFAADEAFVCFDGGLPDQTLPRGQGATVVLARGEDRTAVQVDVQGKVAYARIYFKDVPADVRPYTELELTWKGAASGALQDVQLQLSDGAGRSALLKIAAPKTAWETRRLKLSAAAAPPGFDPAQVKSLALNWINPLPATVSLARVAFLPGPGGWRLTGEELVAQVFGEKRAKEARLETSAHFDVWSDAPARAHKALVEELEKEAAAASGLFGLGADGLKGFRMPVYGFKSPSDYKDYCTRVLGWNEEQARRRPAVGTAWEIVLTIQGGFMPDRAHRVARAVFTHGFGGGGGAWLQEGAAELTVRSMEGRLPAKELASRVKSGGLWPLDSLVGAESLYSAGTNTAATYDYRPIFTHAATVVEYLLRRPPATGTGTPAERVFARFKALGAVRSGGAPRVAEVEAILGQSMAEFEAAWKLWVLGAGK